jgi:beta-xylosidase
VIIEKAAGMGEGSHLYKIDGKYFITSAWFMGRMKMPCARADRPEGPYEVNPAISMDEDFGLAEGHRLRNRSFPFEVVPPSTVDGGRMSLHQGGIVETPTGEWWGFSMMDYNSVGRLLGLSPVTWKDGWPYFGLPGNLTRTPRTWIKPNTGRSSPPSAPYERNDAFTGPKLANVWQWNHVPVDASWSLAERPGFLRLRSLPAPDFFRARNTLTQRSIGPESEPTAALDTSGMRPGDVAGLGLLNLPHAWIGVRRENEGLVLEQLDQLTGETMRVPFRGPRVWLRAHCNFLTEKARFSYSADGETFTTLGGEFLLIFQLKTFQGVRYSLFHYNDRGAPGGWADFDRFTVAEPHPRGLMRPIPIGQTISMSIFGGGPTFAVEGETRFQVLDRGKGRVALLAGAGFLSVDSSATERTVALRLGEPGDSETFQWTENVYGDLMLLSLATHRYLRVEPGSGDVSADHPGAKPDRKDGSCFTVRADAKR